MPFITIIFGIIILILMFTYYSYHILLFLPRRNHRKKIALASTLVIIAICMTFRILLGFLINATLFLILFDVIHLVISRIEKPKRYWRSIYQRGMTAILLSLLLSFYGMYNVGHVKITEYDVTVTKDIQNKDILIATDMHLSTTIGKEELDIFKENVEKLDPDMVLLVGDIYDESSIQEDIEYSYQIFKEIADTYPVYFVSGNHEVGHGQGGILSSRNINTGLLEAGVQIISDDVVELEDMYLIGRQDASIRNRKYLPEIITGIDTNKFLLVMDHQPSEYQVNEEQGIDLQVSGHTHGGQLFPVGFFDSLFHINEMNYGYRKSNNFQAVVSSGMGTWGFKMRTSYECEIVMLHVKGET